MSPISRRGFIRLSALSSVSLIPLANIVAGQSIIEKFRAKYDDLDVVTISFTSKHAKGWLKASKGGKYHVKLPGREMVCDGKSVWHAQSKTKTVVIDRYDPQNEEASIERIFFSLFNVYVPSVLESGKSRTTIRLSPPDESAKIAGIDYVDCEVSKAMDIKTISVKEGGALTKWTLTKIQLSDKYLSADFQYSIQDGWQVVDLR